MISTAYKYIRYERSKSFGILTAIVISIYLVGIELGIFFYLANLIGGIINNADPKYTQVFVVKKETVNINLLSPFDVRWINQVKSIDGVDNSYGVLVVNAPVKLPNGNIMPVVLIGSESPKLVAGPRSETIKEGHLNDLIIPGVFTTDYYDYKTFGYRLDMGTQFEINGKAAQIGLITQNAKGFTNPLMYSSMDNVRNFGISNNFQVNAIIVNVNNPEKIDKVIASINQLAPELKAWKVKDLRVTSIAKVMISNNMGMSFATLILFGIISSFFIIGLTMYSVTYDRIKDYGTLKAIGASNRYVTKLVIVQSLIYALVGYVVSVGLLFLTKSAMAKGGLIIKFPFWFLFLLLVVTFIITVGSSYFSIRKLNKLEPSSVFR